MITEQSWLTQFRPTVNIYVITGIDGLVFDAGTARASKPVGRRGYTKLFQEGEDIL